jgi:hypothetical protein
VSRLPDLPAGLVAQMEAQGGVFTTAQAATYGCDLQQLQRLRTRPPRPLVSVRRGVYAWREAYEAAKPLDRHRTDMAAAALSLSGRAVFTHESAAVALELDMLDPALDRVHVTGEDPFRPHLEAGIHHHVADLPKDHLAGVFHGIELSGRARTAVDIARDTDRLEVAVAAFDSALRMGVPRDELRRVFASCRSWPGARLVAQAIDLADGRAANPGESFSRVVLVRLGLAPDDLQVEVHDEEGLVGYADFGWRGVLGEFDGMGKYGLYDVEPDPRKAAHRVVLEKIREDRLRVGHEVVRWGPAELHRPAILGGRVRAAMARAVARGLRAS